MRDQARWSWMSVGGLVLALMLSVLPLPAAVEAFKPDWVIVMLLFWSIVAPQYFGLLTAFAMGLALDVLTGALLGQNALAALCVMYLSLRFHLRIRAFPLLQLGAFVAVLLGVYQFVLFWIDGVAGRTVPAVERLGPLLTGTIILMLCLTLRHRDERETRTRIEA